MRTVPQSHELGIHELKKRARSHDLRAIELVANIEQVSISRNQVVGICPVRHFQKVIVFLISQDRGSNDVWMVRKRNRDRFDEGNEFFEVRI